MDTEVKDQKPQKKKAQKERFFIIDYMWHIFEIKHKQDQLNVRVACDMFITNLELDTERYKGAKGLKYKKIRKMWRDLKPKEKKFQRKIFEKVLNKHFCKFHELFAEGDKDAFIELCKNK